MRDPKYDILFEPIQLGPVTAKNRFYQVPHCSGMGWHRPNTLAGMRAMKAEGGWGVVCTEYCSINPTSDDGAFPHARLWDADDLRNQALMADGVHEHGGLAGVELWHGGSRVANLDSRMAPLGVGPGRAPSQSGANHPVQARQPDKTDIKNLRRWQGEAARRAIEAGFDVVYVYATHGYLLSEFLYPETNQRTDEYGGSVENRVRIVRELIEETLEAVAGKAAVATRFTVDLGDEETYESFSLIKDLPDLWDLTVDDYGIEMGVSRFVKEAALEDSVARAKAMTSKPVVAVGRFTSPDTMARVIKAGSQDMIGAARPSIADPFLPKKIEEGRLEDIRECIGCNICYAHDTLGIPIRCTQNPTMGEEWRRGWHPEHIERSASPANALIVGAGPAGLEAARVLGERGFDVMLAEATRDLGGRVTTESRLPGLSEWARVRDWRTTQLDKLMNVEVFRESHLAADDVMATGAEYVLIATGSQWRTDGIGNNRMEPWENGDGARIVGVDAILAGDETPAGRVVIYDDDHYYMASVVALALVQRGNDVTLVTTAHRPVAWGSHTAEISQSNAALRDAGVDVVTYHRLDAVAPGEATVACVHSDKTQTIKADWVVPVTNREPAGDLYEDLLARASNLSLHRIGDCDAPGTIAAAVYSGYRTALELGEPASDPLYRRQL